MLLIAGGILHPSRQPTVSKKKLNCEERNMAIEKADIAENEPCLWDSEHTSVR
jgi:hypothetical protein